jgi:chemotaxis protein histidine kinase CheA
MNITVFKVDEKLFGVESEKVVKLFKVPDTLYDKFANQQKIRLKDFEVRLVDLNTIFSVPRGDRKKEFKILAVKDNGEYKGLMVDNVIKKLSTHPDIRGGYGEYFLGMIHSTHQEKPVEIPILDVKKF